MIHKVTNGTAPVGADAKARIHSTIQDAVDQAKPGDIIEIGKGRYEEKLTITTSGLTLIGESSEDCIITYGDFARKSHEDGRDYGTFRSYTCLVLADDVALMNLTVENSAGDGRKVGQAIALFAEGDRLIFRNCRLIGHQDTLFTGPLPQNPIFQGHLPGLRNIVPTGEAGNTTITATSSVISISSLVPHWRSSINARWKPETGVKR